MKTIYIHAGVYKTGTSTLQAFFAKNKELLKQKDIYYPTEGLYYHPHRSGHHVLVHTLGGEALPDSILKDLKYSKEKCIEDIRNHANQELKANKKNAAASFPKT